MADFKRRFQQLFETFGYPLTKASGTAPEVLTRAEQRLELQIPKVLRDYYLVAGRERRFNTSHNRLLSPDKWRVDNKRLIFMEENQVVVWWGVSLRSIAEDPPVSQGVNDDEITWYPQCRKLSTFLMHMLHYQAINGGFNYCSSGSASEKPKYKFEKEGWTSYGEVGSVFAYGRQNQAVCLMPPEYFPHWTVIAGGKTARDLKNIATELGVELE